MFVTRYECPKCGRLLKSPRGVVQHTKMKHDEVLALEEAETCDVEEDLDEIPKKPLLRRLGFTKPNVTKLAVGLGLALIVGPLWILGGIEKERESEVSAGWPHVEGVIIESRLEPEWNQSSSRSYDVPVIVYRYSVDGKQYEGERVTYLTISSTQEPPEIIDDYPLGETVPVYHDPIDPSQAVLVPGRSRESVMGKLGIALCIIGFVFAVMAFRRDD